MNIVDKELCGGQYASTCYFAGYPIYGIGNSVEEARMNFFASFVDTWEQFKQEENSLGPGLKHALEAIRKECGGITEK